VLAIPYTIAIGVRLTRAASLDEQWERNLPAVGHRTAHDECAIEQRVVAAPDQPNRREPNSVFTSVQIRSSTSSSEYGPTATTRASS